MLVASKRKVTQALFPKVKYERESRNGKGENQKVVSEVGFFEIEKQKVLKDDGRIRKYGDVIKDEFVITFDENNHKKVPYKYTLMISIQNGLLTTAVKEATEEDKITFKEAYELYLADKAEKDAKKAELEAMKKQLEDLEKKKTDEAKKTKKTTNDPVNNSI